MFYQIFQGSTLFVLLDVKSGNWHVILDRESSLMTTYNTPWVKLHNFADALLVDENAKVPHDKSIITC